MRQSCDRCHTQKLRCTRPVNNEGGACSRCLRKRVQCIYSFALPKGRPSVYQHADDIARGITPRSANENIARLNPLSTPPTPASDPKGSTLPTIHGNLCASANNNVALSDAMECTEMSTDTWPWLDSLDWDNAEVDWNNSKSAQATFNRGGNWYSSLNPERKGCLALFPGLLESSSSGCMPGSCNPTAHNNGPSTPAHNLPPSNGEINERDCPERPRSLNNSTECGDSNESDDSDVTITQLTQLNMHLSRLRRLASDLNASSETLSQPTRQNQAQLTPLIDDATFESVAAWVAHGSAKTHGQNSRSAPAPELRTTGSVLFHLFSASNHVLEIIRHLQSRDGLNTLTSSMTARYTHSTVGSTGTPNVTSRARTNSSASSYSRAPYFNNVIRHLLIACHTALMNIYISVLAALEYDANLSGYFGAAAVGNIRLVSIVMLCSYLTERHNQAICSYISHRSTPPLTSCQYPAGSSTHQATQGFPDDIIGDDLRELRTEIQQRLARVQQILGC